MERYVICRALVVVIGAVFLFVASAAPVQAITDSVTVDVTVQAGGALSLSIKDQNGADLTTLSTTLPAGSATLNRVSFGEIRIDYFVADAFDLRVYTDDGNAGAVNLGIPGVTDPSVRLLLRTWTPGFGPAQNDSSMILPDAGTNTPGFKVPDPKDDVLWNDPTTVGNINAVWAFLSEKGSTDKPLLSSSSLSDATGEPQIQAPLFRVYFAADLLGVKAQQYQTGGSDGQLIFELLTQ